MQIVFEGVVGRNGLGNIAIDDISIAPGVCPTAPQVAAASPGDCSFEDDECGWQNPDTRWARMMIMMMMIMMMITPGTTWTSCSGSGRRPRTE